MGDGYQRHASAVVPPGEMEAVSTAEEAGWAPVPVWTRAENLAPSGLDSRAALSVVSGHTD